MSRRLALVLLPALLLCCRTSGGARGAQRPIEGEYRVRSRDVLKVSVYEHPDLTLSVRAGNEGTITFPLLGEVSVVGKTEREVERQLARRLGDGYLVDPQVSVLVEEYKDYFYVTGEVNKPGAYRFEEGLTVIKAITVAGGMTPRASSMRIKIARESQEGEKKGPAKNLDASLHDEVRPNDVVIVPEALF